MHFRLPRAALAVSLLLLPILRGAEVSPETVLSALRTMKDNDLSAWSFEVVESRNGGERILFHGPGTPGRRPVTLLKVDGRDPTMEELEQHAEDQTEAESRSEDADEAEEEAGSINDLEAFITPGTLHFEQTKGTIARFNFVPRFAIEGEPEPQKALLGTLRFDLENRFVSGLEIRNQGDFKPKFGVKLTTLTLDFAFQRLPSGSIAPARIGSEIKGRAFLLAGFDEATELVFRDFRKP